MLRFLADENIKLPLVRGLQQRSPGVDIVRAQDVDLRGIKDPGVLAWAAHEGRILLTHDAATRPAEGYTRLAAGEPMPGIIVIPWTAPLGLMIDNLWLIVEASRPEEWDGRVEFLPL